MLTYNRMERVVHYNYQSHKNSISSKYYFFLNVSVKRDRFGIFVGPCVNPAKGIIKRYEVS